MPVVRSDAKKTAGSIYKVLIDESYWKDEPLNENRPLDKSNMVSKLNYYMNEYESDMISEAPLFTSLVSKELKLMLVKNGHLPTL